MGTKQFSSTGSAPYVLAEQNHAFIRQEKWEVAVLPFGACEPHNYHLPYGTDIFEAEAIGRRACGYAYERGAKVLLLPCIPFGVNTNQFGIPGAVTCNFSPTTLLKIIADMVDSLERRNINKLLLLNSHGGNELKPLARELHHRHKVFIAVCDWFRMVSDVCKEVLAEPGDHADEMETSMGLELFPHLVKLEQAGSGAAKPSRFEAVNKGWVSISRPWHTLTEDTGVGNPAAASAEKARKILAAAEQRLGTFLLELAKSPMDERFPF